MGRNKPAAKKRRLAAAGCGWQACQGGSDVGDCQNCRPGEDEPEATTLATEQNQGVTFHHFKTWFSQRLTLKILAGTLAIVVHRRNLALRSYRGGSQ